MSTQTWLRDVYHLLADMGVTYRLEYSKRHAKLWLEKDGVRGMVTISLSPSDKKTLLNVRQVVRRQLGLVGKAQRN